METGCIKICRNDEDKDYKLKTNDMTDDVK